jgi:hypothetical protein
MKTAFAKEVEKKLIDMDKPLKWLIEEVRERTGLYFDSSYYTKLAHGKRNAPKIVAAIREIMDIDE